MSRGALIGRKAGAGRELGSAFGAAPGGELSLPARRHALVAELADGLRRCGVLAENALTTQHAIVIGASGGADSTALLLGCVAISHRAERGHEIQPIAVHVHHHLRAEADDDARFVRELCDRFGIEHHIEHVRPGDLPGNLASNARRLRYEALARVALDVGAAHVAVAHHAEDQLETMLIALCRGSGLDGLAGMAWTRPLSKQVNLIRPMLALMKAQCEDFCTSAETQWRVDQSNFDVTKRRARLRRDVLPLLEELWPDAARRAGGAAELIEAANVALQREVVGIFGDASQRQWDRKALSSLDHSFISAGLRRAAVQLAPDIADELSQQHLRQAAAAIVSADRSPHVFHWPRGLTLRVNSRLVTLDVGDEDSNGSHG